MVTINGKNYKGKNVSIINNKVYIDGKEATIEDNDSKEIKISIEGDIHTLDVDYCEEINISGSCAFATSKNGNFIINGEVRGNVESKNGNIICKGVLGDVNTKNGNIIQNRHG